MIASYHHSPSRCTTGLRARCDLVEQRTGARDVRGWVAPRARWRRARSVLVSAAAFAVAVCGARAQLPGAKLEAIFPASGQPGTTLEVSATGSDLNGAQGLAFSHPGISGTPVMAAGPELHPRPQWARHRFEVTIGADVPTGIHHAWFVGRYGASNPVAFVVDDLPQPPPGTGNHSPESAHPIALNSAVVGRADQGKADHFSLPLEEGARVVIDCHAERIGSPLDALVAVFDPAGRQLARSHGDVGRDPVIAFEAPSAGAYRIEVSDFLSAGGPAFAYRMTVSDRPHIDAIIPASGFPGTTSKHTLIGKNLPGGAPQIEVEIAFPESPPSAAGGGAMRAREIVSAGVRYRYQNSNTVRLALASAPVASEVEQAAPQQVSAPVEITGRLDPPGDEDAFRFAATAGSPLVIEAVSHRAGFATDLRLTVLRESPAGDGGAPPTEQQVAAADDDANNPGGRRVVLSSRDPVLTFAPPEDGNYVVRLVDQFQLSDPRATYRLAIRPPRPGFSLVAEFVNPIAENKRLENWAPVLLRGGQLRLDVTAVRRDGFAGPIALEVSGLPQGVSASSAVIPAGQNAAAITLTGGGDLPDWAGALRVTGRAALPGGAELRRDAFAATLARDVGDYDAEAVVAHLFDPAIPFATSSRAAPMVVELGAPQTVETSLGATVEIPIKVAKAGEFKGAAKFYADGIPGVKKRPEVSIDLGKADEGKLAITLKPDNENKYAAGTFEVHVRADAILNYHPDPLAAAELAEDVKRIDALATEAGEALKQAEARKAEVASSAATADQAAKLEADADAAIAAAKARAELAGAAKQRAEAMLNEANNRNKPRDLKVTTFSAPLTLAVAPSPVRLAGLPERATTPAGGAAELPVNVERRFGFAGPVELSVVAPEGVAGVGADALTVPADQGGAQVSLRTSADTPPGTHTVTLVAKAAFNGVNTELRQPFTLEVAPPPAAEPPAPAPEATSATPAS